MFDEGVVVTDGLHLTAGLHNSNNPGNEFGIQTERQHIGGSVVATPVRERDSRAACGHHTPPLKNELQSVLAFAKVGVASVLALCLAPAVASGRGLLFLCDMTNQHGPPRVGALTAFVCVC